MMKTTALIVGGGVAGIACARILNAHNLDFLLVESGKELGGRVRSDYVDGYVFDRGFQVFNSEYTNTLKLVSGTGNHRKPDLEFHNFRAGAVIHTQTGMATLCDPLREPGYITRTLMAPIGNLADRIRMLGLWYAVGATKPLSCQSVRHELEARSFSESIIEQFFRPFLSGIFLEDKLSTCTAAFKSVFSRFARGYAQLPEGGMGAISRRMAAPLPQQRILLNEKVVSVSGNEVLLATGERISAKYIVLAVDVDSLRLLFPALSLPLTNTVTTFYFESNSLTQLDRLLHLNGTGRGHITSAAVLDRIAGCYSPRGKSLISASTLHESVNEAEIAAELRQWFPVTRLEFLKSYTIRGALPQQEHPLPKVELPGYWLCGDYLKSPDENGIFSCDAASIESATMSGIRAGEKMVYALNHNLSNNREHAKQ